MANILSLGLMLTTGLMWQDHGSPVPSLDCWSTAEVKKAFARPVFHDRFVDGKINRLARHPWNRAQSAIGWYMAVSANEALNKTKSPEEADKVVRATINGWTLSLNYHQTLYLWHTIYQFDDYYSGDPFWARIGKDAWMAKEIGGLSVEGSTKLPPVADIAKWTSKIPANCRPTQDRIRYDSKSGTFQGFPSSSKPDRATFGISVDDRAILRFQEESLLTYARTKKAPWSTDMQATATGQIEALKKSLSAAQKAELDKALGRFHTELAEALQR